MKFSRVSSHALCGVSVASALSFPRTVEAVVERDDGSSPLALDHFGWFETISLDDAKDGILKSHNGTISKIIEDLGDELEDVAGAIADAFKLGHTSSTTLSDVDESQDSDTVSAAAVTCSNPNVRFEWRSYSDTDRHAFVNAFKCLMNSPASGSFPPAANRFEDLVRVHQAMTSTIHGNGIFLFWHRYYVWVLEQVMREECGFDRAFPWWDETLDAGAFSASSIFTADFFGTLPGATNGQGTCITNGVSKDNLLIRHNELTPRRLLPTLSVTSDPALVSPTTACLAPLTSH